MSICDFISELNKLRKSSSESIDNVSKFDEFKKYMHVERNVERDLKNILKKVNESGRKTWILMYTKRLRCLCSYQEKLKTLF